MDDTVNLRESRDLGQVLRNSPMTKVVKLNDSLQDRDSVQDGPRKLTSYHSNLLDSINRASKISITDV